MTPNLLSALWQSRGFRSQPPNLWKGCGNEGDSGEVPGEAGSTRAAWGGRGGWAEQLRAGLHLPRRNKGCKSSVNRGNRINLKLSFQGEILVVVTVSFCHTGVCRCDFWETFPGNLPSGYLSCAVMSLMGRHNSVCWGTCGFNAEADSTYLKCKRQIYNVSSDTEW